METQCLLRGRRVRVLVRDPDHDPVVHLAVVDVFKALGVRNPLWPPRALLTRHRFDVQGVATPIVSVDDLVDTWKDRPDYRARTDRVIRAAARIYDAVDPHRLTLADLDRDDPDALVLWNMILDPAAAPSPDISAKAVRIMELVPPPTTAAVRPHDLWFQDRDEPSHRVRLRHEGRCADQDLYSFPDLVRIVTGFKDSAPVVQRLAAICPLLSVACQCPLGDHSWVVTHATRAALLAALPGEAPRRAFEAVLAVVFSPVETASTGRDRLSLIHSTYAALQKVNTDLESGRVSAVDAAFWKDLLKSTLLTSLMTAVPPPPPSATPTPPVPIGPQWAPGKTTVRAIARDMGITLSSEEATQAGRRASRFYQTRHHRAPDKIYIPVPGGPGVCSINVYDPDDVDIVQAAVVATRPPPPPVAPA